MKNYILLLFVLMLSEPAFSQTANKYTISGFVRDSVTGEELIGATIFIREIPATGATTNAYGFYSLTIPEGDYTVISKYIGYKSKLAELTLKANTKLDFILAQNTAQLNEVVITAERKDENITKTQMGVEKIEMKEIEKIPVLFGEKDVLKTIQLRPGVKSAGEGGIGFYVRGGGADQNLILLDEATVYNASHLFSFFSVFNSDALKDVTLYKGGQPAEYGGRLSSVLDIKMLEGNDKKFAVEAGYGLAPKLKIEGPIVKDKASFILSGRRTLLDLFMKLSSDTNAKKLKLYFYDFNAKVNYRINDKNRVYLSGYFGKDVLGLNKIFGVDWGNATGTLRWNHLLNMKMFSNTSIIFSNYNYNIHVKVGESKIKIASMLQDYNLKQDMQYFANSQNKFKFGFNSIYHKIIPGTITNETDPVGNEPKPFNTYAWENALYFSHEVKPSARFSFEYGIRFSSFSILGPGKFYTYDEAGEATDTASYSSAKFVKTYFNPEPRVAASYVVNEKSSVKASYGRNIQNLHLMSNSNAGSPTDLWIPSSNNVKPEIADQISLGYFRNFSDNNYEFSAELYYKKLQHQIDYKDGAELDFSQHVEALLLYGQGRAYGIEIFIKKSYGKFTGWVGYTLSRSEKKIAGINSNKYYASKQDRTHDISIVGIYELSAKWSFSATWVYYTGNAVTFPSGKYEIGGQVKNYYTERNAYRMPAYHRLDLGLTWLVRKRKKYELSYNIGLYNAYGRQNAYTITFRQDPDDPTRTQAVQTSLFRWIPSTSINLKF